MKENQWSQLVQPAFQKEYFQELEAFLNEQYATNEVYPPREDIFHAIEVTDYEDVKVVILGQDPYHGPNQAHGLSFSVQKGVKQPPSLKNIFKELQSDIGCRIPTHGCLEEWAEQGVLLLNTVLTVRRGEPNSHKGKGWEVFTDEIITLLNKREEAVIFVLWGKHAEAKKALITNEQHIILSSPHPSPFSAARGFFGSKPFSKINEQLRAWNKKEIEWGISE